MKNVPINLSNLKSKVDKLDDDELLPVIADFGKLSHVVKNDVVKIDVYNTKIKNIEVKISDVGNLATNTTLNAETNKVKNPQLIHFNRDFSLADFLFGSIELPKNADLNKYNYCGYGIAFDSTSQFLLTDGSFNKSLFLELI